jgi:hypothetical protein
VLSHRRFTLADGMILVAATAVGLAMARAYDPRFSAPGPPGFLKLGWGEPACVVAALALALILLRARRPQPRLRHMLLRPGMAACCALAAAVTVAIVFDVTHFVLHPSALNAAQVLFNSIWYSAAGKIPWAVGGAWLTLTILGRWRPATSWLERAGRGVGLYWCLYPLLEAAAPALVHVFPFLN